ncbi:MAG: hypothetical protein HYY16_10130 [Planctomycetes bacterium]|nr:hypothetical protein [Planctomycetota bacterium]
MILELAVDVVLLGVLVGMLRKDDSVDFTEIAITAILLAFVNLGIGWLAAPVLGLAALPLIALVDTAIIYWRCALTWPKALICAGVLLAAKFGVAMLFAV